MTISTLKTVRGCLTANRKYNPISVNIDFTQIRFFYVIIWLNKTFKFKKIRIVRNKDSKDKGSFRALLDPHTVQFDSSSQHCRKFVKILEGITFVPKWYKCITI